MDFKSLLSQLDQLNEATEKTKTGVKHTAEPGGYGRKDDEDDEGNKVKAKDTEKKGRGRPKKATQSSGEDKKYDFSAFGVKAGKDVKLPKWDKKKTKKHSIKEYLDQMDKALNEAEQVTVMPAQSNTQVIKQGTKTLGTVTNPQLAAQIKQSIGKGEMSLAGDQLGEEDIGKHNNATTGFDALVRKLTPKYGKAAAMRIAGSQLKKIKEADQPPRDALASPLTLESKRTKADDKAEKAGKKVTKDLEYDMGHKGKDDNKAEKAGKKVTKDIEYDEKKKTVKEAAKPDYIDLDKDGNKKESMKKAAQDKKKKVKEGMDQRLNAARSEGKAHGLRGHAHCGKNYEDMEEARCYHEGYKEGLDECYGQMPIQGYVGETTPVVNTMASYGAEEGQIGEADIEESPFSWAAKNTPKGEKFKLGGKEFVKNDAFAFESWDKQLNALLEGKDVTEGMTVSISKGQQGAPDSVSVSAQDGEADQLLSVIKTAGLGLFGGDEATGQEPMTVDHGGEPAEIGTGGNAIEVVGDHDGMMSLMKKLSGIGGAEASSSDYEDEEGHDDHEHTDEEACNECGMAYESCGCDHGDKEVVDEVESEDQETEEVAEDNPPDSGAAEVDAEDADVAAANASAAAYNPSQDVDEGAGGPEASEEPVEAMDDEEEDVTEGVKLDEWANDAGKKGTDESFESDIDFMMNVISGGLNKRKQTGQTTIPVIANQVNRTVANPTTDINESTDSVSAWRKLAGIK